MGYHYNSHQCQDMSEARAYAQGVREAVRKVLEEGIKNRPDGDLEKQVMEGHLRSLSGDSETEFWENLAKFIAGNDTGFTDDIDCMWIDSLCELYEWQKFSQSTDVCPPFHARCTHEEGGNRCEKLIACYWTDDIIRNEYDWSVPRYWHEISWYPGTAEDSEPIVWFFHVDHGQDEVYNVRCGEHYQ